MRANVLDEGVRTPSASASGAGPSRSSTIPPLSYLAPAVEPAGRSTGAAVPTPSPAFAAAGLFAAVWLCFAGLVALVPQPPPASDLNQLSHLLVLGVAVLAVVLGTLSVAHLQVAGLRPRASAVAVLAAGALQGRLALSIGGSGLWAPAGHVFELIGCLLPLTWVAGDFQQGVRRQRAERRDSVLTASVTRARHEASRAVQAAQRHDLRSMLFVVDGAARTLADTTGSLSPADREMFGRMVGEGVERLSALMEIRPDEIGPFAADAVAGAVVHAERKVGRTVTAEVPAGLAALGRSADVVAVLRTLCAAAAPGVTGQGPGARIRGEMHDGAVVLHVEPAYVAAWSLSVGPWRHIQAESLCSLSEGDEQDGVDLYVAARLLADQGADLWTVRGVGHRFAVRLPADQRATAEVSA
ncbi:MAG TPA: hypothetical protein VEN99_11285 [Acidimicrobiia bacterium]|nr:hypothetical protein [Acidimicrobiia bacterium]